MKKLFSLRWMFNFFGLVASAVLFMPAPLYAQGDYDLEIQSIEGHPVPLEAGCYNRIKPHFSINGTDDHFVPSGGASVHFRYHANNQPSWIDIGDLPATYSASDGAFATGNLWPDSFASVSSGFSGDNSIGFSLPDGAIQVSIEATVNYAPNQTDPNGNAIVDTSPGNNKLETSFTVQSPTSCTLPPPTPQIVDICKVHPKLCWPIHLTECHTPGCGIEIINIDPGNCPVCGGGLLEVIVSLPADYRVVAYAKGDREVARSILLQKVMRVGGRTYNQKLVFESKKDESYTFKALSNKRRFGKAPLKADIQIRKMENIRKSPGSAGAPLGGRLLTK